MVKHERINFLKFSPTNQLSKEEQKKSAQETTERINTNKKI